MGILGLSTFLNKYYAKYCDTLYLHDSLLVIDGNNLMYFLLSNPRGINAHLVGGDYVFYAKRVREYFQNLKNCHIVPIVIFDGCYELEKWKTVLKRYKDALKDNVHSQMPGNTYTPVLMSTVFREILVEQKVLHYQTEFEADDTMAFVAKKLQCPLLSSDSDFYIYPDIHNIPLGSVEFRKSLLKKDKEGQKRIHTVVAKTVSLKRLCKEEFKFKDLRLLPLAAVILGNDRISSATFANLHKEKGRGDKNHRIKYVFDWLGKHQDYDHVIKVILLTLKERERKEILSLVENVLRNYEGENGEQDVWDLIVKDLNLTKEFAVVNQPVVSSESNWYLPLHTKSVLPPYLLKILRNKMVLFPPQVEISHLPSTHALSVNIIRTTAGILLGDAEITIITRQRKNVVRLGVRTFTKLHGFGPIPTIHQTNFQNKAISLVNSLFELTPKEIDFINQWPPPLRFILTNIFYLFKKMRNWDILRPMAIAILLLYLKPNLVSNQKKADGSKTPESLSELIRHQTWTEELSGFFSRFDGTVLISKTRPYEISFVYIYSQFQCLMFHSLMLCKLLGNPFRNPKLQFLNSHFVYNVTRSVIERHGKNCLEFIHLYFGKSHGSGANMSEILLRFLETLNKINRERGSTVVSTEIQQLSSDLNSNTDDEDTGSDSEEEANMIVFNRFKKLAVG